MQQNFPTSLDLVLAHEGGFSNHPKDPGGATNRGVTQRVYDAWRERKGLPKRSVRQITIGEARTIYLEQYWAPIQGDELPLGLDYALFDFAVNSGVSRAVKELQKILGVRVDGVMGTMTLGAIRKAPVEKLIEDLCYRRMAFLEGLKHWNTFKKGWTRRVMGQWAGAQDDDEGVIDRALMMVAREPVSLPVAPVLGKAEEMPRKTVAESKTVQATVLQIATSVTGAATAMSALNGTAQIVAIVAAGLVCFLALWILRERLAAWAAGVR